MNWTGAQLQGTSPVEDCAPTAGASDVSSAGTLLTGSQL